MLPQPRPSGKAKRNSKRLSAPPKTLSNDIKKAQPRLNTINSAQIIANNNNNNNNNNANDNILDLFDVKQKQMYISLFLSVNIYTYNIYIIYI